MAISETPPPDARRPMIVTIANLCWLVPVGTVIICTTWSMQSGLVPVCFPLLDGCLSISAACRPKPVVYLFRTAMLPMSIVMVWFWLLNNAVLTRCLPERGVLWRTVLLLSITGSVFLVLYVLLLGTEGRFYEFLRRIGIYLFFGGTGFAQLLTTIGMRSALRSAAQDAILPKSTLLAWRLQLIVVLAMLIVGPLNLLLKEMLVDSRTVENVIEWNFGLAMFCWFGLHAWVVQARTTNFPTICRQRHCHD